MKRGEVWIGNWNPNRGAEVGKIRPVLVMQTDLLNDQSEPTIVVLPLTTQLRVSKEPLRVTIPARDHLLQTCQVMPEQPRTLDRVRFGDGRLTRRTAGELAVVERSLMAVLGML